MIHQNAISSVGKIKGNVFVGLLGARASVRIPDVHALPVLHKGGKALAHTVYQFSNRQGEHLAHVGLLIVAVVIGITLPVGLHQGKIPARASGDHLAVSQIGHGPVFL